MLYLLFYNILACLPKIFFENSNFDLEFVQINELEENIFQYYNVNS